MPARAPRRPNPGNISVWQRSVHHCRHCPEYAPRVSGSWLVFVRVLGIEQRWHLFEGFASRTLFALYPRWCDYSHASPPIWTTRSTADHNARPIASKSRRDARRRATRHARLHRVLAQPMNKQIRRCTDVIRVLPAADDLLRLAESMLIECHDRGTSAISVTSLPGQCLSTPS